MTGYYIEPNRFELRRFFAKVQVLPGGCWLWRAGANDSGYGVFSARDGVENAHRVAHRWFIGPIAGGHQVDHLCSRRRCVNPAHLQAVSRSENVRRAMERAGRALLCKRGHPRAENRVRNGNGSYACGRCLRDQRRQKRARGAEVQQ